MFGDSNISASHCLNSRRRQLEYADVPHSCEPRHRLLMDFESAAPVCLLLIRAQDFIKVPVEVHHGAGTGSALHAIQQFIRPGLFLHLLLDEPLQ